MSVMKLPGGSVIRFEEPSESSEEALQRSIGEALMRDRDSRLSQLMAAAVEAVGPLGITGFELVEEWQSPGKIAWYFRRRA